MIFWGGQSQAVVRFGVRPRSKRLFGRRFCAWNRDRAPPSPGCPGGLRSTGPQSPRGGKTSAGRPCGRSAGRAVSHAITNTSGVWPCHPHGCPHAARPAGWLAAPPRPPSATHGVSWCSANQRGEAARSVSPAYPLPCFMRPWQSAGRISTSTPRPPPLPTPGTLAATRAGILESPPLAERALALQKQFGKLRRFREPCGGAFLSVSNPPPSFV